MKKFITISTLFAGAALAGFAATPLSPDSPITAIVACSQEGGEAGALKIMEIQKKENLDISRDTFLISLLAACENADPCLIKAAKDGNSYAIKAIKMRKLADAEDALLELSKSSNTQLRKEAIDALSACGSKKSLDFFIGDISTTDASNLVDYVKVSTELYQGLDTAEKTSYKEKIQGIAENSNGKIKAALERILIEPQSTSEPQSKKRKKKKS